MGGRKWSVWSVPYRDDELDSTRTRTITDSESTIVDCDGYLVPAGLQPTMNHIRWK